jgi:hypothetical protein
VTEPLRQASSAAGDPPHRATACRQDPLPERGKRWPGGRSPRDAVRRARRVGIRATRSAVLVLRRDRVEAEHFRAPTVLPVLGIASCPLLSQQEARTWGLAAVLLLGGIVLYALTRLTERRSGTAEGARRG